MDSVPDFLFLSMHQARVTVVNAGLSPGFSVSVSVSCIMLLLLYFLFLFSCSYYVVPRLCDRKRRFTLYLGP
jgi:hypothetical protein